MPYILCVCISVSVLNSFVTLSDLEEQFDPIPLLEKYVYNGYYGVYTEDVVSLLGEMLVHWCFMGQIYLIFMNIDRTAVLHMVELKNDWFNVQLERDMRVLAVYSVCTGSDFVI